MRKDRKDVDDNANAGNFNDQQRSNDTLESTTDDAPLYQKHQRVALPEPRPHRQPPQPIASAVVTPADGYAESKPAKAMTTLPARRHRAMSPPTIMLGPDNAYEPKELIEVLPEMNLPLHVAQNKSGRQSAVPYAIASNEGYAISWQKS